MQCAPLLEDLHRRMMRKVLDSGHIYTDDTTLPLQNDDPARRSTVEAKLWVYAKDHRHGPPLIVYEFSRSRSRDAPLTVLADYQGYHLAGRRDLAVLVDLPVGHRPDIESAVDDAGRRGNDGTAQRRGVRCRGHMR